MKENEFTNTKRKAKKMSISNNKVCGIIVLYNPDVLLLKKQLISLRGQVDDVIYIDNSSKNRSSINTFIEDIRKNDFEPFVIWNSENMGLGYAQNQGIYKAREMGASHVLILDHDSVLQSCFVTNLIETENLLKKNGFNIGAMGPMYYNAKTGEIYPITKYIGPFIKRIKPSENPVEASFLISSGCFISLKVIDKVGGMNEDLFVDYIDVEWSFRAQSYGYKMFVAPKAKMDHQIGDRRTSVLGRTISVHSPLRRYYLFRNSIFMFRQKDIYFGYKLRELIFNSLRLVVFLVLAKDRFEYLKFSFAGFRDGLKGRTGKCPIDQ